MDNKSAKPRKCGAPSKYKPEYCQQIIDYFSQPITRQEIETWTTKSGTVIEKKKEVAEELRFIEDWCDLIGIAYHTPDKWAKRYPDTFGSAYARAKALQKRQLVKNAVAGRWNSNFSIFTATNITDMRLAKQEVQASGSVTVKVIKFTDKDKKSDHKI